MITETKVDYPDPLLKQRAMPLPSTKRRPERSTTYAPLQTPPDIEPLQAVRLQVLRNITNVTDKMNAIVERMDALREDVHVFETLQAERDQLREQLRNSRAKAVAIGKEFDDAPTVERIDKLTVNITARAKNAESARGAIQILQSKRDQHNAVLANLNQELGNANAAWLRARHKALTEQFRLELHLLHRTLAKLLAVEGSDFYRGTDEAYDFLEKITLGVRYDSPFRPDWFNTGERRAFPGFSAAAAALDAELRAEEEQK